MLWRNSIPTSFAPLFLSGVFDEAEKHHDEQALASLIMHIAMINVWNRLKVTTKQVRGEWTGQYNWRTESRLVVDAA